jgi:hypothetical protein
MKIYISTENCDLFTDNIVKSYNLSCFNEYKMNYDNIQCLSLNEEIKDSDKFYKNIFLIPNTHINNIWHLMHHIFMTYKYLKKNNITTDEMFFIFFKGFYERQGNITDCTYKDLIFKGLGFDYDKFKYTYDIFKKQQYITIDKFHYVNENINFHNEPLFDDFKISILNNFDIQYRNNTKQHITFILRKGTREITNIDEVKNQLKSYCINYTYLEDLSIKKQIDIVANTDILIGVHGAGLTWCIFMKANSLLLEMYPGNSNTDNYIRWCNIAKVKYKRLCVDITRGNEREFRKATVYINNEQLKYIQSII